MKIQISKEDFEQSILVATSSHSEVFESVEPHFVEAYNNIQQRFLGYVGEEALETNERLSAAVVKAVCLTAFLANVRHLDLVLTPTGFGVVANNEVSPASSARVEALVEQCRVAYLKAEGEMITWLSATEGWGESLQAKMSIPLLVFSIEQYAFQVKQELSSKQWKDKLAALYEADAVMRRVISDEQMDDLLEMERGAKDKDDTAVELIFKVRRCMIFLAEGLLTAYSTEHGRLLRYLDANLDKFKLYADSSSYKANHFKEYQNEKEKPAFVFNS